jgi:hypothetical protein
LLATLLVTYVPCLTCWSVWILGRRPGKYVCVRLPMWAGPDRTGPPTRANARIECAPMLAKFNSHDRQRAPRPTWRAIACVRMRSTRPDVCKDLGLCMSPIATCTTPSLRVGVRSHAFERARRRANAFARVRTRALVMYVCYFI